MAFLEQDECRSVYKAQGCGFIFGSLRTLQSCAMLGGDKFSFPSCSHSPSLVAVLDPCSAEGKLLWAHALSLVPLCSL